LSAHELAIRLDDLGAVPADGNAPLFAEPWQAQAFALAVQLCTQGHFTWREWTTALAAEIKAAELHGEAGDGSHYYLHWLAALERVVMARGLTERTALLARKEQWAEAYRRAPHGTSVQLGSPC
jgi:nitrile hydratase accessory protein